MNILIFANAFHLISGGDKIFVEYGKRWKKARGVTVSCITNEKGKQFCLEHGMDPELVTVWRASWTDRFGVLFASLYKAAHSAVHALSFPTRDVDVVFSASFIWPDLLPGLIMKLKKPAAVWVVASYVFVTPPWSPHFEGNRINGALLFLVQTVSLAIVRRFADGIFVASKQDIVRVQGKREVGAIAIRGGVDYVMLSSVPKQELVYDGVFLGRFHPQKNIGELLDIWKHVLDVRPASRLALVGAGPLEGTLKKKVENDPILRGSIEFLGVLDGFEKAALYNSCGVFVSASRFDSGMIALDEAMACGIPGVVYDLPHLDYPQGVVKIPLGNHEAFAKAVLELLARPAKRLLLGRKAQSFAATLDWDKKSSEALQFIRSLL